MVRLDHTWKKYVFVIPMEIFYSKLNKKKTTRYLNTKHKQSKHLLSCKILSYENATTYINLKKITRVPDSKAGLKSGLFSPQPTHNPNKKLSGYIEAKWLAFRGLSKQVHGSACDLIMAGLSRSPGMCSVNIVLQS